MTAKAEVDTIPEENKSTAVEQFFGELSEFMNDKKKKNVEYKNVKVVRKGNQITIPDGMSYANARMWLERQEEAEETWVDIWHEIKCYPLDGARALNLALHQIYGFAQLVPKPGFFGPQPPSMVSVETGPGEFEQVPWGRIQPVGIEGHVDTAIGGGKGFPTFAVSGEVKKKHESAVKRICQLTEEILKSQSIYKGRAFRVSLEFLRDKKVNFDPSLHSPKFMDVRKTKKDDLIINKNQEFEIETSLYLRLERQEACLKNAIPLKHGVLLMGSYGTGKTLTAKVLAKVATDNAWSFIYVEHAEDFSNAIRFSQLYTPAVVFCEDIDKVMRTEKVNDRTIAQNAILNVLDGIDTKDTPIITVLTTNFPQDINPGFLRAGRIDTVVNMKAPDAETAPRFIEKFMVNEAGDNLMKEGEDITAAGAKLGGMVPAFIREACNKATLRTVHRVGEDIVGQVTSHDLELAAESLREHVELVNGLGEPPVEVKGNTPVDVA